MKKNPHLKQKKQLKLKKSQLQRGVLGKRGEKLAEKHLKNKGYLILDRNFQSKYGEIDIIALDRDTVVFVEVKTRWSKRYGSPIASITPWKINRLIKTAQYYQIYHPKLPSSMRLDAVLIKMDNQGKLESIEIVKNLSQ